MPLSRRTFMAGLSLAASSGAFSAPAFAQAPRRGGQAVYLLSEQPTNLVALLSTDIVRNVSAKITEGLLDYDFDLKPLPQLATAWAVSPDGLTYTFTLRQGVKWHDGQPFTADDAAFSLQLVKDNHPRGKTTFANVSGISTPDAQTVVLTLSKPAPYMLAAFSASETPIVPKHLYEGTKVASNPYNAAPIGTGPFKFKEWQRGSYILLERNADYWDAPKPYLDQLVFRTIADPAARATAFESGDAHVGGEGTVPLSQLADLTALPHLTLDRRGKLFDAGVRQIEFNLDNPYFAKLEVRRAVAHAIDKRVILNTVWYGYGDIIKGPISTDLRPFYTDDLPSYDFDPATAEKLLDSAGLPRGAGGIRFKVTHDPRPLGDGDIRTAQYLKSALAKVGIDVTVRSQDFGAYIKRVYTDRDFDFITNGITNGFDPTIGTQRLYWSKTFTPGVPFSNATHYNNPEVDRLLEAAAIESDSAKRFADFKAFQTIVANDLPSIDTLSQFQYTIYNKKLVNHTTTGSGINANFADAFLTA